MSADPRKVGVHFDSVYEKHDTGPGHPESADRYRVLESENSAMPFIRVRVTLKD